MINKKIILFVTLLFLTILCIGCGGGGGGSVTTSVLNPITTSKNLESGLNALNSTTPDYNVAKEQLNQVIISNDTTSDQKAMAYTGIGWANLKTLNKNSDVNKVIDDFSNAIRLQQQNNLQPTLVQQAYIGRAITQILKDDGVNLSLAISDLESAQINTNNTKYSDNVVKTNITFQQLIGYKAFLHLLRNETNDNEKFQESYNKLKEIVGNDKNAQLMLETFDKITSE